MGDSYRPDRAGGHSNRDYRRAPPPNRPRSPERRNFRGNDHYRPFSDRDARPPTGPAQFRDGRANNRGEFTFRSSHQAPSFNPINADEPRAQRRSRQNRQNNPPPPRRLPWQKGPSERPLLQAQHESGQEQVLGVATGSTRFLNPDDLSESEAEMEMDSDVDEGVASKAGEDSDSHHKSRRVQSQGRADGNSVPKWSNPDPYTVLPPPDETQAKKKDFVQLIRKAKITNAEAAAARKPAANNDDFISLNFNDDTTTTATRFQPITGSLNEVNAKGSLNSLPPRPPQAPANAPIKRRRVDEESSLPTRPQKTQKRKRDEYEGGVLQEWLAEPSMDDTPWLQGNGLLHLQDKDRMLDSEIRDFYAFVRPRDFEENVRRSLINRMSNALRRRYPDGRLLSFGSFAAGLYLPSADMDLVFVSDSFYNGGPKVYDTKKRTRILWEFLKVLKDAGIAVPSSVTVIGKAKVPIIKFTDKTTNLKVDLSFELLDGVKTQSTFDVWKSQFADMPALVSLIKQFLVMRGLNEVNTGGLGGFTTICLVISFLHHHANENSNLGELFMSFLDWYGNKFNIANTKIVMNPPSFVTKGTYDVDGRKNFGDRLTVVDPNRADNNISGGSKQVELIFKLFSEAHKTIKERMDMTLKEGLPQYSFLQPVYGGNYSSYQEQRERLLRIEKTQPKRSNNRANK